MYSLSFVLLLLYLVCRDGWDEDLVEGVVDEFMSNIRLGFFEKVSDRCIYIFSLRDDDAEGYVFKRVITNDKSSGRMVAFSKRELPILRMYPLTLHSGPGYFYRVDTPDDLYALSYCYEDSLLVLSDLCAANVARVLFEIGVNYMTESKFVYLAGRDSINKFLLGSVKVLEMRTHRNITSCEGERLDNIGDFLKILSNINIASFLPPPSKTAPRIVHTYKYTCSLAIFESLETSHAMLHKITIYGCSVCAMYTTLTNHDPLLERIYKDAAAIFEESTGEIKEGTPKSKWLDGYLRKTVDYLHRNNLIYINDSDCPAPVFEALFPFRVLDCIGNSFSHNLPSIVVGGIEFDKVVGNDEVKHFFNLEFFKYVSTLASGVYFTKVVL